MSTDRPHHPYGWHDVANAAPGHEAPWAVDEEIDAEGRPRVLGYAPSEVRAKLLCLALREHAQASQRPSRPTPVASRSIDPIAYRWSDRGPETASAIRWAVSFETGEADEVSPALAYTHSEEIAAFFAAALTTSGRLAHDAIPMAAAAYVNARRLGPTG